MFRNSSHTSTPFSSGWVWPEYLPAILEDNVRIARGGGIFIALSLGITLSALIIWWFLAPLPGSILSAASVSLLALALFFFRDPERQPPSVIPENTAVSPSDGLVIETRQDKNGCFLAIYLNLLDVHVIRMPISCSVRSLLMQPGDYKPAHSIRATRNTRFIYSCDAESGEMQVDMVAGLLARRIVPYLAGGIDVERGTRIGLIRFGSRVEASFSSGYRLLVSREEKVRGGVTAVAEFEKNLRTGELE